MKELNLLLQSARVSPILRDAVLAVEGELDRLARENGRQRAALEFAREELWHWTLEVERAVRGAGKGRLAQDAHAIRGRIEVALTDPGKREGQKA